MRNLCDECDAAYKGMCTMEDRPCKAKEWYECGRKDAIDEFITKIEEDLETFVDNDRWTSDGSLMWKCDEVRKIAEQMKGEK